MFSIQFCISFYSILNVCHCHCTGNIYENCTQKNDIKMETDLDIKNRNEAIISKNNSTAKHLAKYVLKMYVGKDNRAKKVIPETKNSTAKIKSIDNIDICLLKKKYSIFRIDLPLYDLGIKKQLVTEKMINSDDYLENIDNRNQSGLIEHTGEYTIPRNYTFAEENTKSEKITENVTKIFQNQGMDKNVLKYDLPKNIVSNDMPKKMICHKYDTSKNVKKQSELIEDTGELIIPKNDIVEDQSTIIENGNITENMTNVFQNNSTGKNVPTIDLSKNIENNEMTKNVHKYDSPKDVQQRTELIEDNGEFAFPKNYVVEEKSSMIKKENVTENFIVFLNNSMDKNVQKYESLQNVQKRDISIPENVPNNYKPKVFQNHDAKKYLKYNLHKRIKTNDMPKKNNHHFNDGKPYNYQNDEMIYKNIINKKELKKKDKHTNVSQNVRPQFQTRLNNDLVKKSLDEFKMVRRKTHYTMPDVEFKNDIAKGDIDRYQDVVYPKFEEYGSEATFNEAKNHVKPDYNVKDIRNNMYPTYGKVNYIYQSYEEQNDIQNFKELNKVLARQRQIIEKLTNLQIGRKQKKNVMNAFDKILLEVEAKQKLQRQWKNYTDFTFETPTTELTTTKKPTTILTLFDETEIRLALKNDPHVKRILKMANLKREKYLNNVRKYINRNNKYTHDKEYDMNSTESVNGDRT